MRIEPRAGGAFAFHGRGVLGGDRAQTITAFEAGSLVAFRWSIHDVPTEVQWRIGDGKDAGSSTLEVTHHVGGRLPVRKPRPLIDDLWRYLAGNLAEHLRGGGNVVLPDLASDRPEVRLSIEIDAKPAKVFRALLEPELMNRWLGGIARVDVARGPARRGQAGPAGVTEPDRLALQGRAGRRYCASRSRSALLTAAASAPGVAFMT